MKTFLMVFAVVIIAAVATTFGYLQSNVFLLLCAGVSTLTLLVIAMSVWWIHNLLAKIANKLGA